MNPVKPAANPATRGHKERPLAEFDLEPLTDRHRRGRHPPAKFQSISDPDREPRLRPLHHRVLQQGGAESPAMHRLHREKARGERIDERSTPLEEERFLGHPGIVSSLIQRQTA